MRRLQSTTSCNLKIPVAELVDLYPRYCRKSSIFYATWYVNIPFAVRIYPSTEHKWKDLRGRSVSFHLNCKISRHIALENCVSPVEFDRYNSTGCIRVGVAIERGMERRNRTRRLCKSSATHIGCCVIKDFSLIVRTSNFNLSSLRSLPRYNVKFSHFLIDVDATCNKIYIIVLYWVGGILLLLNRSLILVRQTISSDSWHPLFMINSFYESGILCSGNMYEI